MAAWLLLPGLTGWEVVDVDGRDARPLNLTGSTEPAADDTHRVTGVGSAPPQGSKEQAA